jgi:hypothetical protein
MAVFMCVFAQQVTLPGHGFSGTGSPKALNRLMKNS